MLRALLAIALLPISAAWGTGPPTVGVSGHGLTKESVASLRGAPDPGKEATGAPKAIAVLFFCKPYCARTGTVYLGDPNRYEDGTYVRYEKPEELNRQRTDPKHLRVIWWNSPLLARLLIDEKSKLLSKDLPTLDADAALKANADLLGGAAYVGGKNKREKDAPWKTDFGIPESEKKTPKDPAVWLLALRPEPLIASRLLSTSANTQVNTDAPIFVSGRIEGLIRPPALISTRTHYGTLNIVPSAEVSLLLEKPSDTSTVTSIRTSSFDAHGYLLYGKKGGNLLYGGGAGIRSRVVAIPESTPFGIPTTRTYVYLMGGLQYRDLELKLTRSLTGSSADVDLFRGTSVSAGLTELSGRYCLGNAKLSESLFFGSCIHASIQMENETGNGDPDRSVFTTNPTYTYFTFQAGVSLDLTAVFEPKQKKKGVPR